MVDDLSDVWKELRALKAEVRQARTSTPFENASVSNGRLRFIGGTLRVDSGGRVEIVGTLQVEGTTQFVGPVTISGTLDITGDTTVTGDLAVNGPWELNGDGDISGDVALDGTMTVDGGQIVVDGNNAITIGTQSGVAGLYFDSGAQIASNQGTVILSNSDGTVVGIGNGVVGIQAEKIDVTTLPALPSGTSSQYVVVGADGILYAASNNGGGDPGNPGTPGDNPGGYIYPVNPNAWTLGDDFAAHVARGSAEPGIDWWTSIGTPIWAPGDGTITAVQSAYTGATGAYVTLVTDAGDWFRFLHLSSPNVTVGSTVSQGDVIAYSGGSGFGSPAGYGPHIHVSFAVGYTGSFPGAGGLDDLLAYMAEN